jgi:hypothetical protein
MKRILILLLLANGIAISQKSDSTETKRPNGFIRYWNQLLNDTSNAAEDQFLVYPTIAFTPETSWELGLSSLYIYYANKDTTNRLSEINGFTFYTLEQQYGFWFDHAIYSDKDKWFFLGRIRVQNFPLRFYGIGPQTNDKFLGLVEGRQILIRERVLRKLRNNFFIGFEFDFQSLADPFWEGNEDIIPKPERPNIAGMNGSNNLGIGLGLVYDTRHNVLNVRDGFFAEFALLKYSTALSSRYDFTFINTDVRYYTPVFDNNVFATQFFGQFNSGYVPFNQLALMGGESMMRGYYLGRFRDKNQMAVQAEYRMLPIDLGFTQRFGASIFGSAGKVFPTFEEATLNDIVFAGGAGLRFLLFPQKDVWVRFDVAFTNEGLGYYLWMGEAF